MCKLPGPLGEINLVSDSKLPAAIATCVPFQTVVEFAKWDYYVTKTLKALAGIALEVPPP